MKSIFVTLLVLLFLFSGTLALAGWPMGRWSEAGFGCMRNYNIDRSTDYLAIRGSGQVGTKELLLVDSTRGRSIKATVWYPTPAISEPVYYSNAFIGHAKRDAPLFDGRYPLLVISHGTGGHRYNQYYLSEFLASHGFIVAAIEHPFNNYTDNRDADTVRNLWHRPKDVSFLLTQLQQDPTFSQHINSSAIGMLGYSLGGYTALVLAGATPNWQHVVEYCKPPMSVTGFCSKYEEELRRWSEGDRYDFNNLSDNRIQAVFVMAPGMPILFKRAEMEDIRTPVYLVTSGRDRTLKGRDKGYLYKLPQRPVYLNFPGAGHYVYLMECPPFLKRTEREACKDIGTPRSRVHPKLMNESLRFFKWQL